MKTVTYSHRNGQEVIPSNVLTGLISVLTQINFVLERYTISDLRNEVLLSLKTKGWSDNIFLDRGSKISITGENERCGLCLQTGNVSRVYADLLKLQTLFVQGKIKAGIIIVPTTTCAKSYTSNAATYERLSRELTIFSQVITMPLIIIGFYN